MSNLLHSDYDVRQQCYEEMLALADTGMTAAEIGDRFGISATAVRSRLSRARRRIAKGMMASGERPDASPSLPGPFEELDQWRRDAGMTVRELAKALGIGETALRLWRTGRDGRAIMPTLRAAVRVEELTGIPCSAWCPDDVEAVRAGVAQPLHTGGPDPIVRF